MYGAKTIYGNTPSQANIMRLLNCKPNTFHREKVYKDATKPSLFLYLPTKLPLFL
jgi:hypothetical protein